MLLVTRRLRLAPVQWTDFADIAALKADPRVFAVMLGGVRTLAQAQEDMAADQAFWARSGLGMWAVRDQADGHFIGLTGIMDRPDGRGPSLRFAVKPEVQGRGLAREAAGAALRDALDRGGLDRVIAVTRQDNYGSRTVLGGIGMREVDRFLRHGHRLLVFETQRAKGQGRPGARPLDPAGVGGPQTPGC